MVVRIPIHGRSIRIGKLMPILIRRCVAGLLAGAILFASTGITPVWVPPVEQPAVTSDSDEGFFCKDHQCGCQTAEMCRTHCCCRGTVAASSPQPAARSCCADQKAGTDKPVVSTTTPETAGLRLVIQSAECAGRGTFWLMKSLCWVLQPECLTFHLPMDQDSLDTQVAASRDQINLPPEPPPPRAC